MAGGLNPRQRRHYEYSESYHEYHSVALPFIRPVKGATFGLPDAFQDSGRLVQQMGPLLSGLHPVVPDNGYSNFVAAFRKRCNYHNDGRVSARIVNDSRLFYDYLFEGRKPFDKFEWSSKLYEDWLAKFGEEKRLRMDKALDGLITANLSDYSSKDVFVKVEALLVEHKPNWAPRVIYKGTDLYNAISGPMFNELMRRFDLLLESRSGRYQFRTSYRKVPTDYTEYLEDHGQDDNKPAWIETDFSANDMTQCRDVQLFEVSMMRLLGCPEWFIRLHLRTGKFTVKSKTHRVKAQLEHMLPTGATDTTFRNTLWNGIILYSFLRATGASSSAAMLMGDDMLARIHGLKRYACKTYISIASEARMDCKAFRRSTLFECSFLSKFFVPRRDGMHLTVPILGKAIARFNMRANNNDGLSNAGYMAGKSVGYAYEFRHLPPVRDMFLRRFAVEFTEVRDKEKAKDAIDISWNARTAGVTLHNIRQKIFVEETISDDDFFSFCYERYGLFASDVLKLFEDCILSRDKVDIGSVVVDILAHDFL